MERIKTEDLGHDGKGRVVYNYAVLRILEALKISTRVERPYNLFPFDFGMLLDKIEDGGIHFLWSVAVIRGFRALEFINKVLVGGGFLFPCRHPPEFKGSGGVVKE